MRLLKFAKFLILAVLCSYLLTACDSSPNESATGWKLSNYSYGNSIWSSMGQQFQLDHYTHNDAVRSQISWYQAHQDFLYNNLESSAPFIYYIYQQTQQRGLPAELALLPVIESQYNPNAHSHAGAIGLWQLMPSTAHSLGVKVAHSYDGRRDVVASTKAALDYLAYLHTTFNKNWLLAIAAYDCGFGKVLQTAHTAGNVDFWRMPLPAETRNYIPKLLALAAIIQHPDKYHMQLPPINNEPYFAEVKVTKKINLATAAKTAGISLKILHHLNPAYVHAASTNPKFSKTLLVPVNKAAVLAANLAEPPKVASNLNAQYYYVREGDSLSKIASRYHLSVAELLAVNNLKSNILHTQQRLTIPKKPNHNITSTVVMANAQTTTAATSPTENSTKAIGSHSYHVAEGDSLTAIAQRYNISAADLKKYNHLRSTIIKPGEILYVPVKDNLTADENSVHKQPLHYIVRTDDSLIKIARQYNVAANDIQKWNDLNNATTIQPGQKLIIYAN